MECLISIDGLSVDDVESLANLLPRYGKQFLRRKLINIQGSVLTSAQAIWAELLTGAPWFKNGCVGFAHPDNSLNALTITREKNLLIPMHLLENEEPVPTVIINFPLVNPHDENRVWLADGSLPINKNFSPRTLDGAITSSKARPYADIGSALGHLTKSISDCLEVETARLKNAITLLKTGGWSKFFVRITAFDQLTHLLGLNFLNAHDLASFPSIRSFLNLVDDLLMEMSANEENEIVFISAFSHSVCRGALNLNSILGRGDFLTLLETDSSLRQNVNRFSAATAVMGGRPTRNMLDSFEGRLNLTQTKAASPVSGCVYINRTSIFQDGCVPNEVYQHTADSVYAYLRDVFTKYLGSSFALEKNPDSYVESVLPLPEFIVKANGFEFHNMPEMGLSEYDFPRTTHESKGFALFPTNASPGTDTITPVQFHEIFNAH